MMGLVRKAGLERIACMSEERYTELHNFRSDQEDRASRWYRVQGV